MRSARTARPNTAANSHSSPSNVNLAKGVSYCANHRTETAHACPKAGEWARRKAQANQGPESRLPFAPKPNILTHEQQCSDPACKTLINTPLVTGVHCEKCRREYCLKHRFTYDHNCVNLTPLGGGGGGGGTSLAGLQTSKEKGLAALDRLRAWGASKKSTIANSTPQGKSKQSAAQTLAATTALKNTAKGDDKIPRDQRIYLHVEASSETLTAKIPRGKFFYGAEWSVGRMLDAAAKALQVSNVNNRSESEEDKLRVFHVEGGRLLDFGEKVGGSLKTGNTIVLLRGVGPGLAPTPERVS
ncbi:related to Zn-finger protein [Ramularia collo-cygni]|uniref:Related to Zn-finger protein n=1 Tax=Ramularia collo-cygni TaxID=112498 RepID=A0A2D3UUT2_9PEZI|nr:related to Zn-finger protein [Ramularia collo-cygni]CZT17875.1 related to Zn-finger protein [Ramularia collo-cygni]